jgi:hypothetical protein
MEMFDDAEQGYRRAHAIAVASLSPNHPFVATSLKNLVEFCVARDIPLWTPPSARPDAGASPHPDVLSPRESTITPAARTPSPPVRRGVTRRAAAIVALIVGSLAVVLFTAPWTQSGAPATASGEAGVATAPPDRAAPPSSPAAAADSPQEPEPAAPLREIPAAADVDGAPAASTVATAGPVTVVTALVCSAFDRRGSPDWLCTPVGEPGEPGTLTFYTRLVAASDTTVEHRWYRGDRLHQTMRLTVRASPGSGYRTYSRNTVSSERAGEWKVELRAADGSLLAEERFTIR